MPLTLSESSLNWSLRHLQKYGDTDIFPHNFEFDAIAEQFDEIKAHLINSDILSWVVRPHRRCLVPKHRYGFRISTQLDALDAIVFTTLIHEIGSRLEAQRIPENLGIVHSYRFRPNRDGQMYSDQYSYRSFQQASHNLCERHNPSHVVIADIADFFPRLYTHRIDNALDSSLGVGHMHAQAIKRLIGHWAGSYSYGIPVGSAASRLIAELAIADIDQILLSEDIRYVRYSDDFRIFCSTEAEAYRCLTILARGLLENHGLTLQQSKTRIVSAERFRVDFLRENELRELDTLSERFYELVSQIGIQDSYGDIDYHSLTPEHKRAIDQLNLQGILVEQVSAEDTDISLLRFLLRRLSQIGDPGVVELIFENFSKFAPVIRETIEYLLRLENATTDQKRLLGQKLIDIYKDPNSNVSHLEFSRMYILRPFTEDSSWNSDDQLVRLYHDAVDDFTRREILLAMGRSKKAFWFRSRKQYLQEMSPWLRRAFIYGASCLPSDEYRHWVRGIQPQLNELEQAVAKWSQRNPISR